MSEPMRKVAVSEFKARCLALVEDVSRSRVPILVTKRGKPVAKLVPVEKVEPVSLLGSVRYKKEEDLLAPVKLRWEAER